MDQEAVNRERIIALCRELNQIASDILIATGVLIDYQNGHNQHGRLLAPDTVSGLARMCSGWMVLALTRFEELIDPHYDIIPDAQRSECAAIRHEMHQRDVRKFRGSVAAHSYDGKGKPLTHPARVNEQFVRLGLGDTESWYRWVCPWPEDKGGPPGVAQRLQKLRNEIADAHGISRDELARRLLG